ncbi:MAG: cobyrinate a,c-diamide synthase [Actinomycetota bacterium]|nr:MAG: cobyrinate a,c-diamide synthase [Actinomycetota bacterium]
MPQGRLGPRVIIAGTSSGVGKTTVTTAILSALHHAGLRVSPAKVGPDFIDPTYHELACGLRGRTLDTFLLGTEAIVPALFDLSRSAEITVIEGVMGLFDGTLMKRDGTGDNLGIDPKLTGGSTAEVAALTRTPVILILDATATSSSLAAVVEGFCNFSAQVKIAGVVINNYGKASHLELIKSSLKHLDIEIIGAIPRGSVPPWRSRHLGLIPAIEDPDGLRESIAFLEDRIGPLLDVSKIIEIAKSAPAMLVDYHTGEAISSPRTTIAVAGGPAFSFMYPENVRAFEAAGAQLAFFDPLKDASLPPGSKGLYVGGGFPEVFADKLSLNQPLIQEVKKAISDGLPTWAECGGLMWLSKRVDSAQMVGAISTHVTMGKHLTLGYARVSAICDNCLTKKDEVIYGHEFHYSQSFPAGTDLEYSTREGTKKEGFATPSLFASYLHIHLGSQQHLAERFVSKCS